MSDIHSLLNHSPPNKRPRLEDVHVNANERSVFIAPSSTSIPSSVPEAWGGWHGPSGPGCGTNFPGPSPRDPSVPFWNRQNHGPSSGALTVASSSSGAFAYNGNQEPQNSHQDGTLKNDTSLWSSTTSHIESSYNTLQPSYDSDLDGPVNKPDLVCFGMLVRIPGTCGSLAVAEVTSFPVELRTSRTFIGRNDPDLIGEVNRDSTYLTDALLEATDLVLQVTCTVSTNTPALSNGKRLRVSGKANCSLDIILYGPETFCDSIREFVDDCNEELEDEHKLYLQDPVGCERNVPYSNPHRLPPLDSESYQSTFDLVHKSPPLVELVDIGQRPELLDLLDSHEDLPEALQPSAIATVLAKHQKQALAFMQRREQGWAFDGSRPDIWEAVHSGEGICFINRISDARQADEPPAFYGGIIADPMGLGKTLTMIALVASDAHHPGFSDGSGPSGVFGEESSELTLIIVPPALLGTWEEELATHVVHHGLPMRLHHSKCRLTDISDLEGTAVVLTTYHTVSAEWRNGSGCESSLIFRTQWRRVILDEAHYIRNTESQMARAVCDLKSVSRWAVTGTPLQNHLNDLAALLKFLRVSPYNEKQVFDADISHFWKTDHSDEAVKRLKRLVGCVLLRRPKGTAQLPPRHDQACYVDLLPAERELYEQIRTHAKARFDALLEVKYGGRAESFVNVLQKIEAMRMVCNLGILYPSRHDMSSNPRKMPSTDNWQDTAQQEFNPRYQMGGIQCHCCSSNLDATGGPLSDIESQKKPLFSRCLRFICSICVQGQGNRAKVLQCGHTPPCPIAPVSLTPSSLEEPPIPISLHGVQGSGYLPVKVKALVEDLQYLPSDVKCVVFSTWRMTLDVVEAGLKQAHIPALRFDGKVPQKDRQGVINRFRNDPSARVLLLTLSCGAVGLTLTVASRAYLMEPSWNPTLEDQALARIHRIGQKREVTTVRFYVKNSFEENIVKNQEFKRDLAGILLTPGGGPAHSAEHLMRLQALI